MVQIRPNQVCVLQDSRKCRASAVSAYRAAMAQRVAKGGKGGKGRNEGQLCAARGTRSGLSMLAKQFKELSSAPRRGAAFSRVGRSLVGPQLRPRTGASEADQTCQRVRRLGSAANEGSCTIVICARKALLRQPLGTKQHAFCKAAVNFGHMMVKAVPSQDATEWRRRGYVAPQPWRRTFCPRGPGSSLPVPPGHRRDAQLSRVASRGSNTRQRVRAGI
eukprot:1187862-Prorocentrum_minimum.AAC.6